MNLVTSPVAPATFNNVCMPVRSQPLPQICPKHPTILKKEDTSGENHVCFLGQIPNNITTQLNVPPIAP
jgi:hypothetical protein